MSKKLKVLILEDENLILQAISRKLDGAGFDTVSCTSAKQALDYLENMRELPDVIWLDYYLGDMNGLEFMRQLKKKEKLAKIPVVVVSNSASDEKKSAMLGLGAKKYLLKAQHRLEDIIEMLKDIVEKKEV